MASSAQASPARRPRRRPRTTGPTIREVRLIGDLATAETMAPGDRMSRGGRAYRVSARQAGGGSSPTYVHLVPTESARDSAPFAS